VFEGPSDREKLLPVLVAAGGRPAVPASSAIVVSRSLKSIGLVRKSTRRVHRGADVVHVTVRGDNHRFERGVLEFVDPVKQFNPSISAY